MRRLEIPSISAGTFLRIEEEVSNKLSWQDEKYEELVMFLFESTPWQKKDKENLRLNINLSLLKGGRSSVIVLKLAFIHKKQPYGFIIRIHSTEKDAETEKNNAAKLDINSIDCFANCMGQKEIAGQHLVIYQDVGVNMVTESIDELSESLSQRLSSQNDITVFAHNFQTLIKDVTQSFERIEDLKTISHDEHYDNILSQLPPELVINQAYLCQFDNFIFKTPTSTSDKIEANDINDIQQFIHRLSEKNTSTQWFKLNEIWFDKNQGILTGDSQERVYLPFTIEESSKIVYLWIAIPKNELNDIESKLETTLDTTRPCQLIFLAEDITFIAQLKKMGFDTQSCLATIDFQALCQKHYSQLHLNMRHNDLHCGNVLTSDNSFKVIDVGDMKPDLIASDRARLEVSLWFEMSKRLSEFSKQAAETVIENLRTDEIFNTNSLTISSLFSQFLRRMKKGFETGVQHLPEKNEIVLAYVIQILLYQRYSLLDGITEIPAAFNVFCAYWINQFRTGNQHQPSKPVLANAKEIHFQPSGENNCMQVVLIYKRRAQPDEQLLSLLEEHLTQAGHTVLIDRHLKIGDEWETQITAEIKKADAVVILLSSTAIYSEMLAYEVEIAYQTSLENTGKPKLLPVRINFEESLPQELANKLAHLPDVRWQSTDDNKQLVKQLIEKLISPTPKVPPHCAPSLEMDSGAIPLDAKFYVVRSVDQELQKAIARRDTIILIKGARQVGKTSLLARGIQEARETGTQVVLTDFQKFIDEQLQDLESFFLAVGEILADRLDLDVCPQDKWKSTRAPNMNFERYFRREILAKTKTSLLWAMDEADRLLSCPFRDQVFALFRSWHNERALDPMGPCSKLTMVIAYATESYLFIKDQNQSPFNVGTKLVLEDFTLEQVADLNQRHGSPLRNDSELQHFYQLVGGQPYLVRRGFNDIVSHNRSFAEFVRQADHDEGAFGDHLRRILVLLRHDPQLLKIVHGVVHGKPCSDYDAFYRLRSAGIFRGDSQNDACLRCEIYATYLRKYL